MKAIFLLSLLILTASPARALVHTWQGDVNGQWGRDENWANGSPIADSVLLFPPSGQNKATFNDMINLETGSIRFTGAAYVLGGSACRITGGVISTNASTNQINLNLRMGGPMQVTHSQGRIIVGGTLTLQAFSSGTVTREIYSAGHVELRGVVEARYRAVSPSGSIVWNPGTAALWVNGPGTVEMAGTLNNTHGPTSVADGTLLLNKTSGYAVPAALTIRDYGRVIVARPEQIHNAADVTIDSTGRLTVQAVESIDRLDGNGNLTLDGAILTVGASHGSSTFVGRITGTGGLAKEGNGTLILDGTHNYFGPTTLRGGVFLVQGNISSSPCTVAGGTLGGDGRLGALSATAGTVAPGLGGVSAKLRMDTLALGPSSKLSWRQDANGWSGLTVDESVNLNSPTLEVIAHPYFAPTNGQSVTLIDNRGTQSVKGGFANVSASRGSLVTDSVGRTYHVRFDGGDGNDVTLTFINAPMQLFPSVPIQISGGNGNGTLDPGECVHLTCRISATVTTTITDVIADLRSDAEGIFIFQPHTRFGDLTPGAGTIGTLAFQISTSPSLPCGTNISFQLVVRNTSHGAVTIPFGLTAGCVPGTGPCVPCLAIVRGTIMPVRGDPMQQGVLIPSGDGDSCGSTNGCPTWINSSGITRRIRVHSFTNSTFFATTDNCYTLYLTSQSSERLMATVYRQRFDPEALCTTNFMVCTAGLAARSTEQCRFRWNSGQVMQVVVTEFDGTGTFAPYELRIAGGICRPELELDRLPGDRVRISWPTASPAYQLEAWPEFGRQPETIGLPTHVWNGRFVVTNETAGTDQRFFRLAMPWP